MKKRNTIAVAGIRGGSGKTLVSIGIIRAMVLKGYSVAAFKKGPDYIDAAWLTLASGKQCHNLDTFLISQENNLDTFCKRNEESDIAVVEGNRGIFDGFDVEGTHSFAELIKMLNIPVLLVVDCTKCSRTAAALVLGCMSFEKDIDFRGVILNQIAGERHSRVVANSIEKYCGIPVLGSIPKIAAHSFTERHLGLVPVAEQKAPLEIIKEITEIVNKTVDIQRIIEISGVKNSVEAKGTVHTKSYGIGKSKINNEAVFVKKSESPVIGVICDTAFNFYYPENLELLKNEGATLVDIDSMKDTLPGVDGLYIGGGFPETHAEGISKNIKLRYQIAGEIEDGLPVYAECGGLIYLSRAIVHQGKLYPMVGIFPFDFSLSEKPQGHGYTIFEVDDENPFYPAGRIIKGHEFRYSRIINDIEIKELHTVMKMTRGKGIAQGRDGIVYRNTMGLFSHTHALGEGGEGLSALVAMARRKVKKDV